MHLISNLERINIKMLNKDKFYSIIHLLIEQEPFQVPIISNFEGKRMGTNVVP